jgi:succinyl-diaminopimelate desuccinylase
MSALDYVKALLKCPSVTPHDKGALDYLESLLTSHGFITQRLVFEEEGTDTIDNLYARFGKEEPYFLFAGHTDVVPVGDEATWSHPPFAAKIENGELYGRGAVDMKGGIAAFLEAAIAFTKSPFQGSIGFLITGDEEADAINGTVKMLEKLHAQGERFSHCLVGEPTNVAQLGDMVKIGRRGSLSSIVTIKGKQGHVAYPHLAANPLPVAIALAQSLIEKPLDKGNAHFDASNLELTSFDVGNEVTNLIPAQAVLRLNIRYNDEHTLASLKAFIESKAKATSTPNISIEVNFVRGASESFITKPNTFVACVTQAIESVTGLTPKLSTTGGTSDARFIKNYCEVLEFGLVGQTMHKVDERVPVQDLEQLAKIYEAILANYFSFKLSKQIEE